MALAAKVYEQVNQERAKESDKVDKKEKKSKKDKKNGDVVDADYEEK